MKTNTFSKTLLQNKNEKPTRNHQQKHIKDMPSFDETIKNYIAARIPVIQIFGPDRQYIKNCITQAGMDLKTHIFLWNINDKMHCLTRERQMREIIEDIEKNYTIIEDTTRFGITPQSVKPPEKNLTSNIIIRYKDKTGNNTYKEIKNADEKQLAATDNTGIIIAEDTSSAAEKQNIKNLKKTKNTKNAKNTTDAAKTSETPEKSEKPENNPLTITRSKYNEYLHYNEQEEFHYNNNELCDDRDILKWFADTQYRNIVLIVEDIKIGHSIANPNIDLIGKLKTLAKTRPYKVLILLSDRELTDYDFSTDVLCINAPYPDNKALRTVFQTIAAESDYPPEKFEECDEIITSLNGLTLAQARNVLWLTLTQNGQLLKENARELRMMKKDVINSTGMLEFIDNDKSIESLGGLDNLKNWLITRTSLTDEERKHYNLDKPKGIILIGPPGTGKSLGAEVAASVLNVPLLRFDISKVFNKWVGTSEQNLENVLATAEAVAPCVLLCDEIEKYLAGASTSNDSYVTDKEIFGIFLNWIGRRTADVFVIAVGNSIQTIPPEFSRKGRFDEIFLVNYPGRKARGEILHIHLKKHNVDTFSDDEMEELVSASRGYSGAEIETVINESLILCLYEKKKFDADVLCAAFKNNTPQSKTGNYSISNYIDSALKTARPASSEEWDGFDGGSLNPNLSYQ